MDVPVVLTSICWDVDFTDFERNCMQNCVGHPKLIYIPDLITSLITSPILFALISCFIFEVSFTLTLFKTRDSLTFISVRLYNRIIGY